MLDAFRHFLANDSDGRGFVLVGHSQGAGHLDRLVAEEIDGDADLRRRLVSAMLLGTSIAVDEYDHVPPCTAPDDTGCVISYASFRDRTPPPAGSFFGRDDGGPALCSNPADLAGGGPAELDAFLPAQNRSLIGANDAPVTWATGVDIRTPFVRVPGLITGECVDDGTFGYLRVTVDGDPADPRADDIRGDLTPEWGLHLVDVQLAMGDLVQLVRTQGEAYAK